MELVLITPLLVVLLLFAVVAGRFAVAANDVTEAARDAAREASLWRDPVQATDRGTARGLASLAAVHLACHDPIVTVDPEDLRPGGEVVAEVHCTVEVADALGLRVAGAKTFSARAVAVVDRYRGR